MTASNGALDRLFYKPAEAATLLARGRTKVFEAIASGDLRSVKVGASRLIPVDALREYAERLNSGEVH
jgi:excisionase family DNA binding protein